MKQMMRAYCSRRASFRNARRPRVYLEYSALVSLEFLLRFGAANTTPPSAWLLQKQQLAARALHGVQQTPLFFN
jgi:hypothetical protein